MEWMQHDRKQASERDRVDEIEANPRENGENCQAQRGARPAPRHTLKDRLGAVVGRKWSFRRTDEHERDDVQSLCLRAPPHHASISRDDRGKNTREKAGRGDASRLLDARVATERREREHRELEMLNRERDADDRHRKGQCEADVGEEDPNACDDDPDDVEEKP